MTTRTIGEALGMARKAAGFILWYQINPGQFMYIKLSKSKVIELLEGIRFDVGDDAVVACHEERGVMNIGVDHV